MRCEPIMVQEKRWNYQPRRFLFRGYEQRVQRVLHSWDVAARWRRNARRYFEVWCVNGQRMRVIHDLQLNAWFVEA